MHCLYLNQGESKLKLMKKNKFLVIFFFLVLSFIMPKKSQAQIMEVGFSGGLSYYIGDINPSKHFAQSDYGFGAVVKYYDNFRWAFRFQYSNLNLMASDAKIAFKPERGLAFSAKVNDFALMAEFNFFEYWTGSNRNYFTPYICAGISVFSFDSYAPDGVALRPLQTEGTAYKGLSFSVPFGVGVKYSMTKRFGATLEWTIHKTFTDYIDDIHGLYPETPVVVDGVNYTDPSGLYQPGMQRGNGTAKGFGYNCDWFGTLQFTILCKFNLPKKESCHSGL